MLSDRRKFLFKHNLSKFILAKLKISDEHHVKAFDLNWIEAGLAAMSAHGWEKWNVVDV